MRLKTKKPWFGNESDYNRAAPTPSERFADWYASAVRNVNTPGSGAARTGTYDDTVGFHHSRKLDLLRLDVTARADGG